MCNNLARNWRREEGCSTEEKKGYICQDVQVAIPTLVEAGHGRVLVNAHCGRIQSIVRCSEKKEGGRKLREGEGKTAVLVPPEFGPDLSPNKTGRKEYYIPQMGKTTALKPRWQFAKCELVKRGRGRERSFKLKKKEGKHIR